jgi:hypothetical protein
VGRLLRRRRVRPEKEAWIFTNPLAEAATERVEVSAWTRVEDLLGAAVEPVNGQVDLTVEGLDVRVLIVSR